MESSRALSGPAVIVRDPVPVLVPSKGEVQIRNGASGPVIIRAVGTGQNPTLDALVRLRRMFSAMEKDKGPTE